MNIPFELHIALRYLLAKRKQAFISVISSISTLGVVVGVMALVIALALMTGLQEEVRDRILASNPHIFVWKQGGLTDYHAEAQKLRNIPHVLGAAPAILGQGLLSAADGAKPAQLKGIDPALEPQVTDIQSAMQTGSLEALADPHPEQDAVVLGKDLASDLNVSVGDSVWVSTLNGMLSPMGMVPRPPRRLVVAGIFSLGLYEFDSTYGFISMPLARRMFDKENVDLIQLRVDDMYAAQQIAESIPATLGPEYLTEDWGDMNRSLFQALALEKMAISLTIGLIVMVAALNIVASLILLVMEKHRDIAILKTMGASARSVTVVFMLQGVIIGIIGTAVGAAAGWAIAAVADRYQLVKIPMDVYQVSHVPFTVRPVDLALVVLAAIVICFLATIYPSRQAARLDPAQALRYE